MTGTVTLYLSDETEAEYTRIIYLSRRFWILLGRPETIEALVEARQKHPKTWLGAADEA